MLVEPDLDRRELAAALDRHHGLAPLALRFVPAGETAWCWLAGLRLAVFELVDGDPLDDRALADPGMAGRVARLVAAIHAATPAPAVPCPPSSGSRWRPTSWAAAWPPSTPRPVPPPTGWPPRRGRWSGHSAGPCSTWWD